MTSDAAVHYVSAVHFIGTNLFVWLNNKFGPMEYLFDTRTITAKKMSPCAEHDTASTERFVTRFNKKVNLKIKNSAAQKVNFKKNGKKVI